MEHSIVRIVATATLALGSRFMFSFSVGEPDECVT